MLRNCVPKRRASIERLSARSVVCLLLLAVSSGTAAESGTERAAPVLPCRGVSAHRGASATHPENTRSAFREAIRLGVQQIELDVCLTKDKHLVVIHDATVDRTTNGTGKVADLTLAEIKRLDAGSWKGPQFAGERMPTLAEALAVMPDNIWLNLHLKGGAEVGAGVAKQVVRDGRTHQAFLAAGHAAVQAARRVHPEILVCNMDRQTSYEQYVSETIARGADFIQLLNRKATPQDMARLKAAGIRVNYCCTDDVKLLEPLFAAGVEFVLVNQVAPMMRAAEKLGVSPVKPLFRESVPRGDRESP